RRDRPRAPDVDSGVVVGAADAAAVERADVRCGGQGELARAGAVADLPNVEQLGEAAAVPGAERRCDVVVGVRERARDLSLAQVARAELDVTAIGLQPLVVPGRDA